MRGLLVALLLVVAVTGAQAGTRDLPHVTVIGDSVADGIAGDSPAVAILRQGIDLDLEVAPCRRVEGTGCPVNGVTPPSVVQLVKSMGSSLGPYVVVSVGYNDFEDQYAGNVDDALAAMKAAGVKHVWWLTLREAHHPYITMNDDLTTAAKTHPELSIIDWNMYSRSHPDWFQSDGIHLLAGGSEAMATLIHTTLVGDGVALKPVHVQTTALPAAHHGKPYTARLRATNGLAPYRWSLLERAPKGLHLEADGRIVGTPLVKPGAYGFNVRVRDASSTFDTQRLTLYVKR